MYMLLYTWFKVTYLHVSHCAKYSSRSIWYTTCPVNMFLILQRVLSTCFWYFNASCLHASDVHTSTCPMYMLQSTSLWRTASTFPMYILQIVLHTYFKFSYSMFAEATLITRGFGKFEQVSSSFNEKIDSPRRAFWYCAYTMFWSFSEDYENVLCMSEDLASIGLNCAFWIDNTHEVRY